MTNEIDKIMLLPFEEDLNFKDIQMHLRVLILEYLPISEIIKFTMLNKKDYLLFSKLFKKRNYPHHHNLLNGLIEFSSPGTTNYEIRKNIICKSISVIPQIAKPVILWYEKYSNYSPNTPLLALLCRNRKDILERLCISIDWGHGVRILNSGIFYIYDVKKFIEDTGNLIIPLCVLACVSPCVNKIFALQEVTSMFHEYECEIGKKNRDCIICSPKFNNVSEKGCVFLRQYCNHFTN